MSGPSRTLPDITRADVGTILVSPWLVGSADRQRAAVDATIAEWEQLPWPEAFLSLNCFLSNDGERVLNYAQWTSDEAHLEFVRNDRPKLVREIDTVVPGIERPGLVRYRLHRSLTQDSPTTSEAGCVVITLFGVDGPERQRDLVEALPPRDWPHPELKALHFHVSTDGGRVFSYGEWTSEQAHRDFINSPTGRRDRFIVDGRLGTRYLGHTRYRLYRNLARPLG